MLQIKVIDFRAIFYIGYQFTCVLNNFCRYVVKSDNEVKVVVDGSGQKLNSSSNVYLLSNVWFK
jgi:hypothetical protein